MVKHRSIPMNGLIQNQSAVTRRGYRNAEKAKLDKQQTMFAFHEGEAVIKDNPSKYAKITEKSIDPFRNTTCPFCLSLNRLSTFLISTKKGFDRGLGKCPSCGQKMKLVTLVKMESWKPEEYAAFVFDYRRSGFWQKISFATWKNRLKLMGWTKPFWDEYKRLRGDAPDAEKEKEFEEKWKAYEESSK